MSNLSVVTRIGAGERLTESATESIVASLPEGFDPKARGAVTGAVHAWAGFPEGTERPAVKRGAAGNQKSTDYGRGVDRLTKSVQRALATESTDEPVMRVNMKGLGSAVVPADHPAYALLFALLGGVSGEESGEETPALAVVA